LNPNEHQDANAELLSQKPNGYFLLIKSQEEVSAEIDLVATARRIVARWKLLLVTAVFGGLIAASVAFWLPDEFHVEVVVAPVQQQSGGGLGAIGERFGGLAALAGVDLGGGGNSEEAVATLASAGFTREFIESENLIPLLFQDRWDSAGAKWKTGSKVPTLEKAVTFFNDEVKQVTHDRKTGLTTLAITWRSPDLAAKWANGMIKLANERLRTEAISNAEQSVEYLKRELQKTNMVELQQAIYRVMETQINSAMLANIQHQYAFKVIDPAVAPEKKSGPKRAVMILIGTLLGAFLAAVCLFALYAAQGKLKPARLDSRDDTRGVSG
jgi:uncharacterized protein involved in exopolysaccharide biosynthesis